MQLRLAVRDSSNSCRNLSTITPKSTPKEDIQKPREADVLVAGSVAVDLSCDYSSSKPGDVAPQPHTSNPSSISQSIGGVGRNVALAAHSVSKQAHVKFCSMVGDDV